MRIKKIGAVCLSAVLLVSMLLVGNVLPAVADETTVFEATKTVVARRTSTTIRAVHATICWNGLRFTATRRAPILSVRT